MSVPSQGFTLERDAAVARLTLDRPDALNAIDDAMRHGLLATLERLAADAEVGALVVTGRGRAFCAGGDVKGMEGRTRAPIGLIERRQRIRTAGRLTQRIRDLPFPVVAAVNGPAIGLGFSLALAADVVLAGRSAKFAAGFVRIGLVPDGGLSQLLPMAVGRQRSRELMFSARNVDADEAARLGLALEVVDDASLLDRAGALAASFTAHPRDALALTKSLLNEADLGGLDAAVEREALAQAISNGSDAHREAVAAFVAARAIRRSGTRTEA